MDDKSVQAQDHDLEQYPNLAQATLQDQYMEQVTAKLHVLDMTSEKISLRVWVKEENEMWLELQAINNLITHLEQLIDMQVYVVSK